jgi:hypothetical protein
MKSPLRLRSNRDGFALPVAFLVVAFMTAGALGAFARAGSEARTIDNQQGQQKAFAVAAAGLEKFFAQTDTSIKSFIMPGGDTVYITVWDMTPTVNMPDTKTYLVRAIARTQGAGDRPSGSRTVAQFATRTGMTMQVLSAWTSLSGLWKEGSAGKIDGYDAASPPCGDGAPKPGVAVPTGGYTQHGVGTVVYGDPPVEEMGTQQEMASQINIDWAGMTDPLNPKLPPDVIYCAGGYGYSSAWAPCGSWPTLERFANPDYWPVIVINGSSKLPSNGKGTLIVTGDLDLNGGDEWKGIILVGGRITDNGSGHIAGAVMTGLNVLLGQTVGQSSKANGTKEYLYNSCDVMNAASGGARLIPISNAWADNWSAW